MILFKMMNTNSTVKVVLFEIQSENSNDIQVFYNKTFHFEVSCKIQLCINKYVCNVKHDRKIFSISEIHVTLLILGGQT